MYKNVLHIFNETQIRVPRKKIKLIYDDLLKKKYSLNIVFVNNSFSKKLNKQYRNKNKPTNILSFPLDNENAEIYINVDMLDRSGESTISEQILFLLIHGILHILGHKHGDSMEKLEDKYATKYI